MVAIIGGQPHRFRPLIDLYYEAGRLAGHARETLKVGVHAVGYVAATTERAADEFFPGYAATFTKVGKERGWPPTTRAQFDALRGDTGALIVGDAEAVVEKILYYNQVLGGLARVSLQMSVASLPHHQLMSATEILGNRVVPMMKAALHSPALV